MIIEQTLKGAVDSQVLIHFEEQDAAQTNTFNELSQNNVLELASTATLAATGLFELLGAQGTNTIFFEQPVRAVVLARKENDGWSPAWPQKRANPQELESIAEKIRFALPVPEAKQQDKVATQTTSQTTPQTKTQEVSSAATQEVQTKDDEHSTNELEKAQEVENYMIRQLYRIP